MKKIVWGVVAAVAAIALAEEASLGWVFSGYFENISASTAEVSETVDASVRASAEAELNLNSEAPGIVIIFR